MAATQWTDPRWILSRVQPLMERAIREIQADLLFRYSEWLDGEGVIKPDTDGDPRSHEQLVKDFLKGIA